MITKPKHTPGPWSVPHFAEPDINCECGYVLTGHLTGAVCTVHVSGEEDDWHHPHFEEACANARLIAAAPDLRASLLPDLIRELADQVEGTNPIGAKIIRDLAARQEAALLLAETGDRS